MKVSGKMKIKCLGGMVLAFALISSPALALPLDPTLADSTDVGTGPTTEAMLVANTGEAGLTLAYKDNVGGIEEGLLAGSYTTTFSNSPGDPADFKIEYDSGTSIVCPICWLEVKDGNQNPGRYFFDLGGGNLNIPTWNGIEDIVGTGFWPNQGAISHVSIWTKANGTTGPGGTTGIPEPSIILLLGSGFAGLGLWRRLKNKN